MREGESPAQLAEIGVEMQGCGDWEAPGVARGSGNRGGRAEGAGKLARHCAQKNSLSPFSYYIVIDVLLVHF